MKPQNPIFQTLKNIGSQNRNHLFKTFSLVAAENLLWATYPLFGSFAIDAIVSGSMKGAFGYAVLMLIIYGVSASRRRVDTQTFTRIYAEIAVPVILKQREQGNSHSEINARVTLSREFVDFFEHHLPILITSLCSMIGAIVMLLEFWIGLAMSVLFESALWLLTVKGYGSSGHLYAITTYL
ncbi:Uncharacterised protein [Kingella kingae]|nr:Uncharacterised protein [Kingella kingae]